MSTSPLPSDETAPTTATGPLSRRWVLRGAGVLGLGVVAAACGGDKVADPGASPSPSAATSPPVSGEDAASAALRAVGYEGEVSMGVVFTGFELLARENERVTFALFDGNRELINDVPTESYLVNADTGEVAVGPLTAEWYANGRSFEGQDDGLYVTAADLTVSPGLHDLVVIADGGQFAGTAAVNVIAPDDSIFLVPGDAFPPVHTPTTEDPQDLESLCTRTPICGMHDTALDDAMTAGKAVVLTIATPKFCSSAICGPVVDFVEEVRLASGRDDLVWIHQEVFTDAGNTYVELAQVIELPSEPWLFLLDTEGNIVDRISGAVTPQMLTPALDQL